jgi:hypothetical protein
MRGTNGKRSGAGPLALLETAEDAIWRSLAHIVAQSQRNDPKLKNCADPNRLPIVGVAQKAKGAANDQ